MTDEDKQSKITIFLSMLVDELWSWSLPCRLRVCSLLETEKIPHTNGAKRWCLALCKGPSNIPILCGMTMKQFGKLVKKYGGNPSQDVWLLSSESEEIVVNTTTGIRKKCCLIPIEEIQSKKTL